MRLGQWFGCVLVAGLAGLLTYAVYLSLKGVKR